MRKFLIGLVGAICLTVLSGCVSWHCRNFTLEVVDVDGCPVTNATVTVKSCKDLIWGHGDDSDYNFTSASTDTNGIASIDFETFTAYFSWFVETPSHYCLCRRGPDEFFSSEDLERERQSSGLGSSLRRRRFKPSIRRKIVLYPKRNPQPMYAYGAYDWPELPMDKTVVKTNGYSLVVLPVVGYDLQNMRIVDANDKDSDFRFERYYVETNGVNHFYGRMVFAPGCGAYRCKKTGDDSFPTTYKADEKARYEQKLEFFNIDDAENESLISRQRLIEEDEYLVLRTRISTTADGGTNRWHYSKLVGPCRICGNLTFAQSVFNPQLNDCNLEFDLDHNLANPEFRVMCP